MKTKLKSIVMHVISFFLEKRVKKSKESSVWLCDLKSDIEFLYCDPDPVLSKDSQSDYFLKKGPIKPRLIPEDCLVFTQAPLDGKRFLCQLNDAELKGRHPFVLKNNKLIQDTVFFSSKHDRFGSQVLSNLESELKDILSLRVFRRRSKDQELHIGCAILLFSNWNHYGHWVPEHLLKLKIIFDVLGDDAMKVSLIIEKNPPEWKLLMLSALGWDDDKLIKWDSHQAKVDQLYFPSYPMPSYSGYLWLKNSLLVGLGLNVSPEKKRRLYLSRNNYGGRKVKNELELEVFLANKGFEKIHPENMSIQDQLVAFSNAEVVLGPHGSAFTNIIFGENLKVIEFFGKFVPLGFYCYSKVMGHEYFPLFCEAGPNKNDDLIVNIEELENALRSLDVI